MNKERLITFWAGTDICAHPETLKSQCVKHGIEWFSEMLPTSSTPATALERARRCRPGTGFQFRKLGRDSNGNSHVGLVEEEVNVSGKNLEEIYRAKALFSVNSNADATLSFTFVPSSFEHMAEKLESAFKKEAGFLTQPDLGVLFTRLCLERWKGVRIKPGTALFLCPSNIKEELDAVNKVLFDANVTVSFYADEVQKQSQFSEPVKLSLLSEIDDLVKGVDKLQVKATEGKKIRYDTLNRRLETAKDMMTKAGMYSDILGQKQNEISLAVDGYKKSIMQVMKTLASNET